jgi:hypothetical protein
MKLQLGLIVALAFVAGQAVAQGTFSPGHKPSSGFGSAAPQKKAALPSYGVPPPPSYGSAPHRSAPGGFAPIATPQAPPAAQPYKPYKPPTYGQPQGKACERSVFVDACGKTP